VTTAAWSRRVVAVYVFELTPVFDCEPLEGRNGVIGGPPTQPHLAQGSKLATEGSPTRPERLSAGQVKCALDRIDFN